MLTSHQAMPIAGGKAHPAVSAILAIVRRDLLLAMRRKSEVLTALFFFVIVVSLFPLGIGPEPALLRKIAPGVLWVAALLATMLSLQAPVRHRPCRRHAGANGAVADAPGTAGRRQNTRALADLGAAAGAAGARAGLAVRPGRRRRSASWSCALLLGTPVLSLIGAIGAALTLGVRGGGVLLTLLVLPLYIPALIFGAGAVEAHISGLGAGGHLSLLAALLALAAFFAPWATTAALRIALE